jgi:hypothetical protein
MWNMLAIVVSVNVLVILALCIVAFFTGYLIRSGFIKGCKKRIAELEKEMLRDNARILELEKEKVELMKSYMSDKQQ